jgi:hypothetical protein
MEEHVIKILVDRENNFSMVFLDDVKIMEGGFLDFNNKNLGTNEYGEFLGFEGLAIKILLKLTKEGKKAMIVKEKYTIKNIKSNRFAWKK